MWSCGASGGGCRSREATTDRRSRSGSGTGRRRRQLHALRRGRQARAQAGPPGPLDLDALPLELTIRTRAGGERLRPRRGGPTRALKSLLQELTCRQASARACRWCAPESACWRSRICGSMSRFRRGLARAGADGSVGTVEGKSWTLPLVPLRGSPTFRGRPSGAKSHPVPAGCGSLLARRQFAPHAAVILHDGKPLLNL